MCEAPNARDIGSRKPAYLSPLCPPTSFEALISPKRHAKDDDTGPRLEKNATSLKEKTISLTSTHDRPFTNICAISSSARAGRTPAEVKSSYPRDENSFDFGRFHLTIHRLWRYSEKVVQVLFHTSKIPTRLDLSGCTKGPHGRGHSASTGLRLKHSEREG